LDVATALAKVSDAGIAHGDISIGNVCLAVDAALLLDGAALKLSAPCAKLIDFGGSVRHGEYGRVKTAPYDDPATDEHKKPLSAASEVYAFCVLAIEAIRGRFGIKRLLAEDFVDDPLLAFFALGLHECDEKRPSWSQLREYLRGQLHLATQLL
jgi:hypothetical protein